MMDELTVRINKLPFFLWHTDTLAVNLDKDNKTIELDEQKSLIKKVSPIEILLLKHLPIFIIFYFALSVPSLEFSLLGIGFFIIGYVVLEYLPQHFKKFLFLIALFGYYIVYNGFEVEFEQMLSVAVQLALLTVLFKDIYSLFKNDKYYYLKDYETEISATGVKEFPTVKEIATAGLWKSKNKNKKVNHIFKSTIGGFYIKTKKDIL